MLPAGPAHADTVPICNSNFIQRIGFALVGGEREPAERLRVVALDAPPPPVMFPKFKLCFGRTLLGELLENPEGPVELAVDA